jgi:hypothetical protein
MGRIYGLAATGLSLVALYLVLVYAGGARKIVTALGSGVSDVYRTLQGR